MLNLGYLGGVYKQQWKTSLTYAVVKTENCETYSKWLSWSRRKLINVN